MKKTIILMVLILFGCLNSIKAQENIALNKPTQQSSTEGDFVSLNAVDGEVCALGQYQVSMTESSTTIVAEEGIITGVPNWWRVDLEGQYEISEVKVMSYLEGGTVWIGNQPTNNTSDYTKIGDIQAAGATEFNWQTFDNLEGKAGRFLMIQSVGENNGVTLCEVEVYGEEISTESNSMWVYSSNKESKAKSNKISVYPNPSNGQFNIEYTAHCKGEIILRIMDMAGRVIKEDKHYANEAGQLMSDMIKFNDTTQEGVYLLNVTFSDGSNQNLKLHKN